MAERETLEVDVLIVGGGPAGLSAALRIAQLQKLQGGEPLAIASSLFCFRRADSSGCVIE